VVTNARAYYSTRAAAGATGTRLSLRPLIEEGGTFKQNSGASRREIVETCIMETRIVMPRFTRGIQYAVASRINTNRLWNTGSSGQAGRRRGSKLFEIRFWKTLFSVPSARVGRPN
jgi:hypothetical protein